MSKYLQRVFIAFIMAHMSVQTIFCHMKSENTGFSYDKLGINSNSSPEVYKIEQYATGFQKVFELCAEAGVEVSHRDGEQGFSFEFARKPIISESVGINGRINGRISGRINGRIKLSDAEQLIFEAINNDKNVTIEEICKKTGVPERTAYRGTKSLQDRGLIKRIGSRKTGCWEVNI